MKKGILIIISIAFVFVSCSRNIYPQKERSENDTTTTKKYTLVRSSDIYSLPPQKGTYQKMEYSDGFISVDPDDTTTIKKHSLTESFTIINIKKRNGYYDISVQSDSTWQVLEKNNKATFIGNWEYRIISLKTKNIKISKKIKEGQRYTLELMPNIIYSSDSNIIPGHHVMYVYTKGRYISVVSASNIYTTPNLDGLHYINKTKKQRIKQP